ncbi:MAG: hypothetical protein K2Z80_14270 [Xanthobacteraceae bacterium]|nr:hypothetical protein [Xanthobacteraceae bacterium]
MKRLRNFLLVGPLVGFVAVMFSGFAAVHPIYWLVMLGIVYLFGVAPALVAFAVDYWLSDKLGDFKRAAATAVAGYAGVFCVLLVYLQRVDWGVAGFGVSGAVAGLICSLMSIEKQNERKGV